VKFDSGDFMEIRLENSKFVENRAPKYGNYMKTKVGFIFASYMRSPHRRCLRLQRYQALKVPEGV
jgi:hypothetical protein